MSTMMAAEMPLQVEPNIEQLLGEVRGVIKTLPQFSHLSEWLDTQSADQVFNAIGVELGNRLEFQRSDDPLKNAEYVATNIVSLLSGRTGFREPLEENHPTLGTLLYQVIKGRIVEAQLREA